MTRTIETSAALGVPQPHRAATISSRSVPGHGGPRVRVPSAALPWPKTHVSSRAPTVVTNAMSYAPIWTWAMRVVRQVTHSKIKFEARKLAGPLKALQGPGTGVTPGGKQHGQRAQRRKAPNLNARARQRPAATFRTRGQAYQACQACPCTESESTCDANMRTCGASCAVHACHVRACPCAYACMRACAHEWVGAWRQLLHSTPSGL